MLTAFAIIEIIDTRQAGLGTAHKGEYTLSHEGTYRDCMVCGDCNIEIHWLPRRQPTLNEVKTWAEIREPNLLLHQGTLVILTNPAPTLCPCRFSVLLGTVLLG